MKWSEEAEKRIKRVPFFVRRRVRREVEKEAQRQGADLVLPEHLEACRQRYMSGKEHQTPGFEIDQCFGADGCPNAAIEAKGLFERMEALLKAHELGPYLKEAVNGPLKMHHAFRVSVSSCPNSCSRPQIVDFGVIGAAVPEIVPEAECTRCGLCAKACREDAIIFSPDGQIASIDHERCLYCGSCAEKCPAGTISIARQGFRVQLGGKLGRHPRLARELPGIHSQETVIEILDATVRHFKAHGGGPRRLGEILEETGLDFLGRVLDEA